MKKLFILFGLCAIGFIVGLKIYKKGVKSYEEDDCKCACGECDKCMFCCDCGC